MLLGTGEALPLRPADPRHRLALVRAARSRASAGRGRSCCGPPTTRSGCAPSPSATARSAAVVAGGGLLGLEAAYALHKLGLRTTVLERGDRLLRRQLDARASALLQTYLEGLGLEILRDAETVALSTATAA